MTKNKFRIVQKVTTNGVDEVVDTVYCVQRRFLFWWFDAGIKSAYTLPSGGGHSNIMVSSRKGYFSFRSFNRAELFMDKYFINRVHIKYKGSLIKNYPYESDFKEVFVNKSNVISYYAKTPCFEASYSLESLKWKIDQRIKSVVKSTIATG